MRRKSSIKIKSFPRFIFVTSLSLGIIILMFMILAAITTSVVSLFNTQRELLRTTSTVAEAAPADQIIAKQSDPEKTNTQSTGDDPLESIKSRLRSGDTNGIKVVFLTFDDGPSDHTGEVLDILNKYDAKGTFFTTLHDSDQAKLLYQRIADEGHTLANHTSRHDYSLYDNPQAFYADVEALDEYQKQVTGLTETSHVFRFPGGSSNANETCVQGIVNRGWNYSDWNVSSGDGCADPPTKDIIAQTIISGCREHDVSVVLCHAELKPETRAALPIVIETLQAEGYTFLAMNRDFTYPRQLELED